MRLISSLIIVDRSNKKVKNGFFKKINLRALYDVNYTKLQMMSILKRIGIDWRERRRISKLYMSQEAVVSVNGELSEPVGMFDVAITVHNVRGENDGRSNG